MEYDVAIIGSGPGGYVAAIRCAQLGMKTVLIERYPSFGGTCLNVGCIPSKALLDSTEFFFNTKNHLKVHGISVEGVSVDWKTTLQRKEKVISDSVKGIQYLMKKNKVECIEGNGTLVDAHTIRVKMSDGVTKEITAKNVILATGSKPADLPNLRIDKKKIISSTEALSLPEPPSRLIVIGAGVIGLELGSVFARLGTEVHIIEYLSNAAPGMDAAVGKELKRTLTKIGIKFHLNHQVRSAKLNEEDVVISAENKQGKEIEFVGDYCLLAVGRKPYTEGLGLEKVGVRLNNRGFIAVNKDLETSVEGVYAIGDVIGGAMLAHKAEEEGIFIAERLAGQKPHINYRTIPSVVYTWPEAASVGETEEELKKTDRDYKVGLFSLRALGRARAANELDGFIKVLADKHTDEILGIHMVGARAADMIGEAVVALEYRASAEDIARISHAHPTFSEALKEACLAATDNRAIHM